VSKRKTVGVIKKDSRCYKGGPIELTGQLGFESPKRLCLLYEENTPASFN
jgi:hypothetical protein